MNIEGNNQNSSLQNDIVQSMSKQIENMHEVLQLSEENQKQMRTELAQKEEIMKKSLKKSEENQKQMRTELAQKEKIIKKSLKKSEENQKQMRTELAQKEKIIKKSLEQSKCLTRALLQSYRLKKNIKYTSTEYQKHKQLKQKLICQNNHKLQYLFSKDIPKQYIQECHGCKRQVEKMPGNVCWDCKECQTLYCISCKGYRKRNCPSKHKVEFRSYEDERKTAVYSCDICKEEGLTQGWRCECNFDICIHCHNPV